MNLAFSNIGIQDIRQLNTDRPPLLEQIQTFLESAEKHASENKRNATFVLKMLKKNHLKLGRLLNDVWNVALNAENTGVPVEGVPHRGGSVSVTEGAGGGEEDEASNEDNSDQVDEGKYVFRKATPLKEKSSFSCKEVDCTYTVSNFRVFKSHMKQKHQKGVQIEPPKVTCLLPHDQRGTRVNDRHTMEYMCTHLKEVSQLDLIFFLFTN